jgi:hypothetical protein
MKHKMFTYLLLLGSSILPAFFTNSIYGYLPFLFLLFLSIISALYAYLLKKCFELIDITDTYYCERDKELDFTVHMHNKSPLVYPRVEAMLYISDIYGKERFTQSVEYVLAPFEEKDFSLTIRFDHIGSYHAGLRCIKIYGLLGVMSHTLSSDKVFHITVTPKIFNYEDFACSDRISKQNDASLMVAWKSGMEYAGVREYTQGDPIKNIHWNLSAHSLEYLTKKYVKHAAHGISILLDLQAPDYQEDAFMQIFDCIIETALAIAHHAKWLGHQYEILYDKDGFTKCYAPPHFYELGEFMNDLPNLTPEENKYNMNKLLAEHCSGNDINTRSIIICTSNLNQKMINSLVALKSNHKNPMLYYAIPVASNSVKKQEGLQRLGALDEYNIPYKVINSAVDLLKAS